IGLRSAKLSDFSMARKADLLRGSQEHRLRFRWNTQGSAVDLQARTAPGPRLRDDARGRDGGVRQEAGDLFGPAFIRAGGLALYGPDRIDLYRRSAGYVDRILRGEKAGDLPFQQPTKYQFILNIKVAKAVGLELSPALLALADEVIE